MTVYNGSEFLDNQVQSIISELIDGDELIIIDDYSNDESQKIIEDIQFSETIFVRNTRNVGVNLSLQNAISLASNEIIFMADQDDVWIEGRVNKMVSQLLLTNKSVLFSNNIAIDRYGSDFQTPFIDLLEEHSDDRLGNLFRIFTGKAGYYGCTACFRKYLVSTILPVPNYVESIDLWIAKVGILNSSIVHLEDYTLKRRVHNNLSLISRPFYKKIYSRLVFIISILAIEFRIVYKG
jgi:glycosyltransferase involved in cell wall biosynthesis